MQYMPHTKQHMSKVYCRIKTGISGGYRESGKKQDNYADSHYLPFCLTPEKLRDCILGLPTDQYLHMINQQTDWLWKLYFVTAVFIFMNKCITL